MRVLHLIPFLWSGAGDVVSRLAATQAEEGHAVLVVTSGTSRGERDWPAYRRRLRQAGVGWRRVDFFDRQPEVFWRSPAAVATLMAQFRPHVVHAHAGVPTCAATLARSEVTRRVPVISQFYNWGPGRPAWMNLMDITAMRAADAVVCSATHYAARLQALGVSPRRLHTIPWGLADSWFGAPDAGGPPATATIGFIGRVEPRKGQLDLVRAFATVRRRIPGARLELVGPVADAAYASEIQEAIGAAGLAGGVRLVGHVADVRPYLRRWQAFVSLSRDEGQGLAVLEAMAAGTPVLARSAPGVDDSVIDGRTGALIPVRSLPAAGAWIARQLADPSSLQTRARRARRYAERRYRWSVTVDAIRGVYEAARRGAAASERGRRSIG